MTFTPGKRSPGIIERQDLQTGFLERHCYHSGSKINLVSVTFSTWNLISLRPGKCHFATIPTCLSKAKIIARKNY